MEKVKERIEMRTANPADRIALRGVKLWARLSGMCLKARLEQTFINLEDRAIEAIYTFPLIEGAAVCGFEVVTGDHVLTGKIEETGDAIEKYEKAISDGNAAFMAEQERPDVFTIRVGNLKPKQAATVRLTFIAPLEIAEKAIRVAFPTTIAPRYVSAAGTTDPLEAQIDGEALNPPHALHVPYGLSMEVEVALGRTVRAITSPTHAVKVQQRDDGSSRVSFAGGLTDMDRDVVLSISTAKEVQPSVQAARGPSTSSTDALYLAVTFIPDFPDDDLATPAASETIFVLDCSGSMQGESIVQATAALELCLRSLSEGDTFNICRFGSTYELMASEPLRYDSRTLAQAIKYVRQGADLGGTELHAPLAAIFPRPPVVSSMRQVILLTDGQISNEPAVIDLARKHRSHNRIFSFGIGTGCSVHLVKGLARATGGAAEFISGNERIQEKVLRVFGRISSPMVTDVKIDWGGADVQTLSEMPPVFEGEILTVFGRCGGALPSAVTLQCQTPQGQRNWPLPVAGISEDDGVIATMWARRTIQSLEEVNGVRRTSVSDRVENRAKAEMIRLSKEFNLLSALTTFISVEHRSLADRNEGLPELRKVPTMLAAGWGGADVEKGMAAFAGAYGGVACAMPMMAASPMMPSPASAPAQAPAVGLGGMMRSLAKRLGGKKDEQKLHRHRSKESDNMVVADMDFDAVECQSDSDPLQVLLSRQSAEGWFEDDATIAALFSSRGIDRAKVEAVLTAVLPASPERAKITRTLVVLYLLEKAFAAQEDLWRRGQRKAMRWVSKVTGWSMTTVANRVQAV